MNNQTCKHFNGIQNKCCNVGVEYDSVTVDPEAPGSAFRNPCIVLRGATTRGRLSDQERLSMCAKFELPTTEELKKEDEMIREFLQQTNMAREAILQDLKRRWKEGPTPEHGVTAPADISRFHKPQANYFCGAGVMPCPICSTGKLKYSRSAHNGHVHAQCSTESCVSWME